MISLIPKPIRDIVVSPFIIKQNADHEDPKTRLLPANSLIKASLRISFSALGALAVFPLVHSTGGLIAAAAIGSLISLPSVLIVGGTWLLCHAVTATVAAVAAGSFTGFATALLFTALGWYTLEHHNFYLMGSAERVFEKLAIKYREPLAERLAIWGLQGP